MARDVDMRPDQEPAHDVLAAEAFAVPAPDPELRRQAVVLPDDPSGIAEPHDILAAEAFAMPTGRRAAPRTGGLARSPGSSERLAIAAAVGLLLVLLGMRRRGR